MNFSPTFWPAPAEHVKCIVKLYVKLCEASKSDKALADLWLIK